MALNISGSGSGKNTIYAVLSLILILLSVAGIYLIWQTRQTNNTVAVNSESEITDEVSVIPTAIPTLSDSSSSAIKPSPVSTSAGSLTPVITPKISATPSSTIKPTLTPKATVTPKISAKLKTFTNKEDNFSIDYSTSRKVYQEAEKYGHRYTFYLTAGNFAVHIGTNWSWLYPNREFTNNFLIDGEPTFRYDIDTQTIVDFRYKATLYTLQCVHNGKDALKKECEDFLQSFKFLDKSSS